MKLYETSRIQWSTEHIYFWFVQHFGPYLNIHVNAFRNVMVEIKIVTRKYVFEKYVNAQQKEKGRALIRWILSGYKYCY